MQYALQRRWYSNGVLHSAWISSLAVAIAIGIAYFLGARLGLALLTQPDGVAVFWPASGVAAGTLIALGPTARLPVIAGIVAGSILANLMGDRNLAATVVFTLCNVGEPILVASLVERYFGAGFRFDQVRRVLGFFAAAAVGAAAAAVGGATGFVLFHSSGTPFLITWWNWFASATLGVISVAPLVIGLAGIRHERPTNPEMAEGLILLAVLALVSMMCLAAPGDHWFTILPVSLLAPLTLYLAARCRPLFAAATVFILALIIVWTVTFSFGRLGDPSISLSTRILAAQTALLAICGCILVLSALFVERRHHVFALERSNRRLQLALDCAELGTWSLDLQNRQFDNDVRDRHIHGHGSNAPPQTLAQMRAQVHPDDLAHLDSAFSGLKDAGSRCRAEYRLKASPGRAPTDPERWVAIEGAVVHDAAGRAVQLVGITHDITQRKHAETRLRESERELRDLLGALPAAIYVTDAGGRITYCNEAAVNLWGGRPRPGEDRWCDFARYHHADGTPMALQDCPLEIALHEGRAVQGREFILERVDGSRAWIAPYPTPLRDRTGAVIGAVNMVVDITERKQAEQTLAERNAQLALAGQFALIGTFTFDVEVERMQVSPGYGAMHGLPADTEEISRDYWRAGVHPKDLPRVEAGFQHALATRQREHYCEYRIVRAGGQVRWIDSRSLISYDRDGAARIVGANIDVTSRKQTEAALEGHKASLADALAAGRVMAFDWNAVTGRSCRSDNAALMLGIEDSQASSSTHNAFLRQVHPEDRGNVKAKIRELSPSNPTYALTFRFYAPNGEPVWLEETGRGEFDTTGKLLRVKGLTRDITDRKKAELVLEERNVLLALAGKAARVGSFAYDFGSDLMQVSEGYTALYGLPEGQTVVSRNAWLARVHQEDVDRVQELRCQAIRQGLSEYGFEFRSLHPTAGVRWIEARSFISYKPDGCPLRVLGVNIDVTERRRSEDQQRVLIAELDHRVKNVLSTVVAIIAQTHGGHASLPDFTAALERRIKALARTHELLSQNSWSGVSLGDIVRREFAPYEVGNAELSGPHVTLTAEAAQAMAMVVHELTTNAAKYGALSSRHGRVQLHWWWLRNGSSGRLAIEWQEIDGPPVRAPSQTGYGTTIVRELVPYELSGTVALDFAPDGVRCRMEIPPECISKGLAGVPTRTPVAAK
jgi:PAS domain S-box-containing protein